MYPKYKGSHKVLIATHHHMYVTLWAWSKLSTLVCNQEVVSAEYNSRLALWSTRLWHLECNSIILNVSIIYFFYKYIFLVSLIIIIIMFLFLCILFFLDIEMFTRVLLLFSSLYRGRSSISLMRFLNFISVQCMAFIALLLQHCRCEIPCCY